MVYEFVGDTENGELTLREGDIITVLNKVHTHPPTLSLVTTCTLYVCISYSTLVLINVRILLFIPAQARVQYNYTPVSVIQHCIYTVLHPPPPQPPQDIGDGWWEGETNRGDVGLFPESYCEMLDVDEEAGVENGEAYTYDWDDDHDEWDDQEAQRSAPAGEGEHIHNYTTIIQYLYM